MVNSDARTQGEGVGGPSLSVVIIGRNEGDRLVRCLESVRAMRGVEGDVEIIYADSASTDASVARARALGAKVITVEAAQPTAATGRNEGWRAASAEFVLFLDGDTVLDPDFARIALNVIKGDATLAGVWGHRRELYPKRSIYNGVLDLDWIYRPGITEFCGGDVLMRRAALDSVQGYDVTLIAGEEPDMCRRMRAKGHRILHVDTPMTGHDLAMTHFRQYWRRAVRTGHAYAEVSKRYRDTPDPLWGEARRQNIRRGIFWSVSPLLAVVGSLVSRSPLPVALWLAGFALVVVRTAWKARWKSKDAGVLLLYAVHSHLQQVPIMLGQLQFERNASRGRRRGLIEYKGAEGTPDHRG
jgi:glycosyltransferase involved in cell wall biosynthesis